jgi:hypothetical protein
VPLRKLQLVVGDTFDKYANILQTTFGYEGSRVRFYELLLNCANADNKTVPLDVTIELLTVFG